MYKIIDNRIFVWYNTFVLLYFKGGRLDKDITLYNGHMHFALRSSYCANNVSEQTGIYQRTILSDYSDSDMIPNDIVISMFGALIRHVLLILFAVVLIETSGASLLVVASVI